MLININCPHCDSKNIIKNGTIHNGKPKFQCNDYNRQFVKEPQNKSISKKEWKLVDKLLLERLSIAGISRVTYISEVWLQNYINKKYKDTKLKSVVKKRAH